jgi:23S rRNA (guanosine2251-2'-O)-methyltransferase
VNPPPGRTKSGKPRPGTGGHGRKRLAGKGPTPPAKLRPGHPASHRPARAADRAKKDQPGPAAVSRDRRVPAMEVVAGRHAVLEALRAAVPAIALHVGAGLDSDSRLAEATAAAARAGIPVVEAGRAELDRLTAAAAHQGIALRIRPYSYADPGDLVARAAEAGEQALVIALDGVTDPRNLGAVARAAAAFGGHGVLVPVRRSAGVTAAAWKASAGALARLPVARAPNLAAALAGYQKAGLFTVGLDAGAGTAIAEIPVATEPVVLVLGAEGRGLSRVVAGRCDVLARIPMAGAIESLNVSVAAGIALYEVARLRDLSGPRQ